MLRPIHDMPLNFLAEQVAEYDCKVKELLHKRIVQHIPRGCPDAKSVNVDMLLDVLESYRAGHLQVFSK